MITILKPNQIFVFGSNTEGRHGAGAAKKAIIWGAEYGNPVGRQGQTYAIITKVLPNSFIGWDLIKLQLERLFGYAGCWPEFEFLLTPIGTGLAGGKLKDLEDLLGNIEIPQNITKTWGVRAE